MAAKKKAKTKSVYEKAALKAIAISKKSEEIRAKIKPRYAGKGRPSPALPPLKEKLKSGPEPMMKGPLADYILERVAAGDTLMAVCREEGMPEPRTVTGHMVRDREFAQRYKLACELRSLIWAEQLKEQGDHERIAEKIITTESAKDGITVRTESYDAVDRAKLASDNTKWLMARQNPSQFGDKVETTNTTNMNVNMQVKTVKMLVIDPKPMKVIEGR